MLLEELITNCPGIKMGQKNGQKVLKNAKKSQNTFFLISTVRKLLEDGLRIYAPQKKTRNVVYPEALQDLTYNPPA